MPDTRRDPQQPQAVSIYVMPAACRAGGRDPGRLLASRVSWVSPPGAGPLEESTQEPTPAHEVESSSTCCFQNFPHLPLPTPELSQGVLLLPSGFACSGLFPQVGSHARSALVPIPWLPLFLRFTSAVVCPAPTSAASHTLRAGALPLLSSAFGCCEHTGTGFCLNADSAEDCPTVSLCRGGPCVWGNGCQGRAPRAHTRDPTAGHRAAGSELTLVFTRCWCSSSWAAGPEASGAPTGRAGGREQVRAITGTGAQAVLMGSWGPWVGGARRGRGTQASSGPCSHIRSLRPPPGMAGFDPSLLGPQGGR